jgi:hypothetical protein
VNSALISHPFQIILFLLTFLPLAIHVLLLLAHLEWKGSSRYKKVLTIFSVPYLQFVDATAMFLKFHARLNFGKR